MIVRQGADVLKLPEIRALRLAEQEHNYAIGLRSDMRVAVVHLAAVGTVDSVQSHARDVFRELIRHNCAKFVFVHNHPHGGAVPSRSDREVTKWLRHAGEWLGIPLQAHVLVVGHSRRRPIEVLDVEA